MLKTPQQNAAAMYKEYNKLKAAKEHLTVLVAQGEAQLDYLNSVMSELQCAESEKDLADIRLELISSGYDRKAKAVKKSACVRSSRCDLSRMTGWKSSLGAAISRTTS